MEGKQDVFAAGLVLLELFCGVLPPFLHLDALNPELAELMELRGHPAPTLVAPKVNSNLQEKQSSCSGGSSTTAIVRRGFDCQLPSDSVTAGQWRNAYN